MINLNDKTGTNTSRLVFISGVLCGWPNTKTSPNASCPKKQGMDRWTGGQGLLVLASDVTNCGADEDTRDTAPPAW